MAVVSQTLLWNQEDLVTYDPKPIDASNVSLTPEILEIRELLAENAHDHWARQRMGEGWTFGPERNDLRKEHPCLMPYDQLPESEKEYDRKVVFETLKAILALGYRIDKVEE